MKNLEQWPAESPTPQRRDKLKKVLHKVSEDILRTSSLTRHKLSCSKSAHNNKSPQKVLDGSPSDPNLYDFLSFDETKISYLEGFWHW